MRAALYRRVSTSSQVEGFSLQTQLDSLTDLAQRQGYHWEDFCDPGRSGETLEGRPELMRLLANLDRFDAVLVVDDSRLARDELTAAVIRSKLREAEVKLITLSGETDLNDPAGRFTSGVLALTAQLEQDIRREKMMAGLQAAARRAATRPAARPVTATSAYPLPTVTPPWRLTKQKPNSSTPPFR